MQVSVLITLFLSIIISSLVQDRQLSDLLLGRWLVQSEPFYMVALRHCGLVGCGVLVFAFLVRWILSITLKCMETTTASRKRVKLPGRVDLLIQFMLMSSFVAMMTVGGWCRFVNEDLVFIKWQVCIQMVMLLPYLIMLVFKWYFFYDINFFTRNQLVTSPLRARNVARPVWTRKEYLIFQFRHSFLIVIVPVLSVLFGRDLLQWVFTHFSLSKYVTNTQMAMASSGVIFIIFLLLPLIIRYVWSTEPLSAGPLRFRLNRFCDFIGMRYRNILLWKTYSGVANAAVMGLIWRVRYVLMSDMLIEQLEDEQIEAVFGHEAGHIKYHHIPFLMMYVVAATSMIGIGSEGIRLLFQGPLAGIVFIAPYVFYLKIVLFGVIIGCLIHGFGVVSRHFERQADVYGALALEQVLLHRLLDLSERDFSALGKVNIKKCQEYLGSHGATVMASALENIGHLNGISIYSRSWRHSSLATRITHLGYLAREEGALRRFMTTVGAIKVGIVSLLFITIVISTFFM